LQSVFCCYAIQKVLNSNYEITCPSGEGQSLKKLAVILVLSLLCLSIVIASLANVRAASTSSATNPLQRNILSNPGFENTLDPWKVTSGSAVYSIDATSHSGSSSVKGIETASGSIGRLYQDVTGFAIPGDQYQISGWIKTSNVTGNVVIGLDYVTSGNYTAPDGYITEIGGATGTQDWTFFQSPVFNLPSMPSDSVALYFLFDFNMGSGTAWWDDVALVPIASTVISQPTASSDSWSMFGHDLSNARYSSSAAPRTSQILWNTSLSSQIRTSVTVVGNMAYAGSFSGNIYGLDARTGATLWISPTRDAVWSTPTVANGMVYVGSNDWGVYALSSSTGSRIWNFSTGGGVFASPAVVGNVVYVGSTDNNVYALDANTGAKIWNYTTGGQIRDSLAVVDGVVYVGSQNGNFYALDASTGAKIWSAPTGDGDTYTNSSPAVVNGVVYVGSTDGNLYAFQTADGTKVWSFATGAKVSSSPAVFNGVVYVGSEDGSLYAVYSSSGTKIWSQNTGGAVYSSPAIADGLVYVGSWGGTVYAFDASTGAVVWSYETNGGVFSSPTIAGGVMFIGSYDGRVYAFGSSYAPGTSASPLPTSSGSSSNADFTKTAWVPPPANGAAAVVITFGAVGGVALVAAAVSSTAASATGGFLGKIVDKIRELLPDTFKKWLEDVIASKRKLKVDEKEGSPYLPTKSEIAVYSVSILLLTLSFAYVKVPTLSQILTVLPTFFATSILVALVRTYVLATYSRRKGVWTEYKLWYFGIAMFLISTLALRTPFSSPTRTVHHSRNFTERLGGFLSVAAVLITLGFGGIFFILLKSGVVLIGGTGLAMCLISAFFDTFPIEPMSGKDVYKYSKPLWAALFVATLALYVAWLAHIF
jgi:outer membrane protein assembly factor BamB